METRQRSLAKGVSWRAIATLTTMALVWIFTGNLVITLEIGFLEATAKIIFYYLHERVWHRISWGRLG